MSKRTKAGRRASFRRYAVLGRGKSRRDRAMATGLRSNVVRSMFRFGAMLLAGAVADRMMGAR